MSSRINITLSPNSANPINITTFLQVPIQRLVNDCDPNMALDRVSLALNQCSVTHRVAGLTALEAAFGVDRPNKIHSFRSFLVQLESLKHALWLVLIDIPKGTGINPYWDLFRAVNTPLYQVFSFASALKLQANNLEHCTESEIRIPLIVLKDLIKALTQAKIVFETSTLRLNVERTLQKYDWPCTNSTTSASSSGYWRRSSYQIDKNTSRLIGLFRALYSDLSNQLDSILASLNCAIRNEATPQASQTGQIGGVNLIKQNSQPDAQVRGASVSVETARGLLQHDITLCHTNECGWRISAWQVDSPTKQNFNSESDLAKWLGELTDTIETPADSLQFKANLLIKLVNPCYQVDLLIDDKNCAGELIYA